MFGYRSPPEHTRFKKGQSGNPKGRPKKGEFAQAASSANALALKEAQRPIVMRQGTDVSTTTTIEAVFRARSKSALEGSAYAQRDFIKHYEEADRERKKAIEEECKLWSDYVDKYRTLLANAAARGDPPPKYLPHPDDVVIDEEIGVRFIGPIDEREASQLKEIAAIRDALIMQHALDRRCKRRSKIENDDEVSVSLLCAILINDALVKRLRLSETDLVYRQLRLDVATKRALLKEVYGGWKSVGMPRRRGRLFPFISKSQLLSYRRNSSDRRPVADLP